MTWFFTSSTDCY